MNDQRSFERFVADNVAGDTGGDPMPEDFYHDMHTYASHHGQRPEWLALIKEPPMRTNSRLAVGSPTARVAAIMVATLLLALTLAAAGFAGSRILAADGAIIVDQSGNGGYTTIAEAVSAAVAGDEILCKPGVYPEHHPRHRCQHDQHGLDRRRGGHQGQRARVRHPRRAGDRGG